MQGKILAPASGHRIDRRVVPDIGPVAAVPPEFDCVEVRRIANPVDEDQFVLRAVERAHASIGLVPHAKVEKIAIEGPADCRDVVDVPPVHTDEVDGASARNTRRGAKAFGEERRNSASVISPEAIANSRWLPADIACPLMRTL